MRRFAVFAALVLAVGACGSDDTSSTGGSVLPTSPASVPATAESSPPSSASGSDTVPTAPLGSEPATTADSPLAASTTSAPTPVTWTDVDEYPSEFGEGCCGSNSSGPTSPALTAEPAPLADGVYSLEVVGWSPTDPTLLQVSVRGFVSCADGVEGCWPADDGTYGTDEIGFSETSREFDVVLDDSVVVYLGSTDANGSGDDGLTGVLRSTTGDGLADLMAAVAEAYDTEIAAPLSAGTSIDAIVAGLQKNPAHGFTSAREQMTGELYFTYADAPSVLFQIVATDGAPLPRSGTSALIPRTFTVEDGNVTLEFYAGFRS